MSRRAELDSLYRATTYRVDAPGGPIALRIDLPCPALDRLLQRHSATTWAFITAHNPGSHPVLSDEENRRRERELIYALPEDTRAIYPGEGVPDSGNHPPETSVLVVGIDEETAVSLARNFGQIAIVVGVLGGKARLVWTDRGQSPALPPAN
jgi:hypothetical protein